MYKEGRVIDKNPLIRKGLTVGIILLFVGTLIIPSLTQNVGTKSSPTMLKGETLYVGGTGPGNFTKIQDAVDNASKGDTVFVFNGIYYEHVRIHKSIALLGENQSTTIIDGQEQNSHVISLIAENVTLSRFTLQNCGGISNAAEIYINSDNNQITENTMNCTPYHGEEGIWLWYSSGNTIARNTIANHHFGIWLENSSHNTISDNAITNIAEWGIILGNAESNNISDNIISENIGGIYLRDSNKNTLTGNDITKNINGVALVESEATSSNNTIVKNNFIKNRNLDATFLLAKTSHSKNLWDTNYWNRLLLFPKLILGAKAFLFIPGVPFHFPPMTLMIPWFTFDWHPVKEPYDIP